MAGGTKSAQGQWRGLCQFILRHGADAARRIVANCGLPISEEDRMHLRIPGDWPGLFLGAGAKGVQDPPPQLN